MNVGIEHVKGPLGASRAALHPPTAPGIHVDIVLLLRLLFASGRDACPDMRGCWVASGNNALMDGCLVVLCSDNHRPASDTAYK